MVGREEFRLVPRFLAWTSAQRKESSTHHWGQGHRRRCWYGHVSDKFGISRIYGLTAQKIKFGSRSD